MKIIFNKIITNKDTLKISLDKGVTSIDKPVAELLANGYSFTEDDCEDLDNIQVSGEKVTKKPSFTSELNEGFKWNSVSSDDLGAYLSSLADNTVETPYKIKLTDFSSRVDSALHNNNQKYVRIRIPNSVTIISGTFTFESCRNLTSVTLPNSVTEIGFVMFGDCENLTSVTIPNSVTDIGGYAFGGCTSLTTINYTGTEEEWNAITKSDNWNSGVPSNCIINYNYQG